MFRTLITIYFIIHLVNGKQSSNGMTIIDNGQKAQESGSKLQLLKTVYSKIAEEKPNACVRIVSSDDVTPTENTGVPTSYFKVDSYRTADLSSPESKCIHVFDITSTHEIKRLLEAKEELMIKMKRFVFVVSMKKGGTFKTDDPIISTHFFRKVFDAVEFREFQAGKYITYTRMIDGIEIVNFWNGSRFLIDQQLFPDKLLDFRGKVFRANSFDYAIAAYQDEDGEFQGYETTVMRAIGKNLNFKLLVARPPNGEMWGELKENGKFTGMLGQVQREDVDFGWASVYIIYERKKYVDLTEYTYADNMCFMLPIPPSPPLWMSIASPLDLWTWLLLVSAAAVSCLSVYFVTSAPFHLEDKKSSLQTTTTLIFATLFDQSTSLIVNLKSYSTRTFFLLWLLGTFVLKTGYRGGLMSVLTIPLAPTLINTVRELASYPLPVSSYSDTFYVMMNQSLDPSIKAISEDYIVHYDFDTAIRNCSESKVVMGEGKEYLEFIQRRMFTDKNGVSSMRLMKECLYQFHTAFVITKDSPYTARLSEKLAQLKETGLVGHWRRQEKDKVSKIREGGNENQGPVKLQIDNYQAPMMIYGVMMIFAFASFFYELFTGNENR